VPTPTETAKYAPPPPIDLPDRQWPARTLTRAPVWCSVDLRDGNQALPNPLGPDQKLEYFQLLREVGFGQIEVAFPSASQADFQFTRRLIEEGHVEDDLFLMVLTQCRPELIERTFEAVRGAPRAIVHAYIATSDLHVRHVFGTDRAAVLDHAVRSLRQIRQLAEAAGPADIRVEFSPEEFSDTDPDFAVEICEAAFQTWGRATPDKPMILNLPATVERRPPNQYADLIERFCRRFSHRDCVQVSVHAHNDQGMAVAATELALLAGADRVEGALFGHGERTGNTDLVTLACNLQSRGIETGLDFSRLSRIAEAVERLTGIEVPVRQPYAGEYVFTAFSGSHQDAVRKGLQRLGEAPAAFGAGWKVPYLHVDPRDLGRRYQKLIRINAQSGKGGIAWVLETQHGIEPPKRMHPQIRDVVQAYSDRVQREVTAGELYELFEKEFVRPAGPLELLRYWPRPDEADPTQVHGEIQIRVHGQQRSIRADGNGPISAFVHGMQKLTDACFAVEDYSEQAIGKGADAQAMAYVPLELPDGRVFYGVGVDTNIDQAAVRAIVSGLNRILRDTEASAEQ